MADLSFAYSYGSYTYDPLTNGLTTLKMPLRVKERVSSTPGRDGGYSGGGLMDTRTITAKGSIVAADSATMRSLRDAFYAAHAPGVARKLLMNTDRYFLAEVSGLDESEYDGMNLWEYTVSFRADDPYQYDVAVQTTTNTPAVPTGTALSLPAVTLVVGSAPAGSTITISNPATGQNFVLLPSQAATFVIDSAAETVTMNGADASAQIGAGSVFLQFAPGVANGVNGSASAGGSAITSISAQWQNRWY